MIQVPQAAEYGVLLLPGVESVQEPLCSCRTTPKFFSLPELFFIFLVKVQELLDVDIEKNIFGKLYEKTDEKLLLS